MFAATFCRKAKNRAHKNQQEDEKKRGNEASDCVKSQKLTPRAWLKWRIQRPKRKNRGEQESDDNSAKDEPKALL